MAKIILTFLVLFFVIGGFSFALKGHNHFSKYTTIQPSKQAIITVPSTSNSPLAIITMRNKSYPGSQIKIEQPLSPGSNYQRYLVSYLSEGLKIYGLLTVPTGKKPAEGWPVILFNHGYIPPVSYSTESSYSVMIDPLAVAGYIVFKPDYRGNGNSDGTPKQVYISPDYVTDSMNALASIKQYKDANPQNIGVFGHSMGGNITLHELVMTHAFKAAELMAGVVGNETNLANWWDHRYAARSIVGNDLDTYFVFSQMIKDYGTPTDNPSYWDAIDPTKYISFISTPVQIQVGTSDEDVPPFFSTALKDSLVKEGKSVDFQEYQGADHNLRPDLQLAIDKSVVFFNQYLK